MCVGVQGLAFELHLPQALRFPFIRCQVFGLMPVGCLDGIESAQAFLDFLVEGGVFPHEEDSFFLVGIKGQRVFRE